MVWGGSRAAGRIYGRCRAGAWEARSTTGRRPEAIGRFRPAARARFAAPKNGGAKCMWLIPAVDGQTGSGGGGEHTASLGGLHEISIHGSASGPPAPCSPGDGASRELRGLARRDALVSGRLATEPERGPPRRQHRGVGRGSISQARGTPPGQTTAARAGVARARKQPGWDKGDVSLAAEQSVYGGWGCPGQGALEHGDEGASWVSPRHLAARFGMARPPRVC